MPAKEIIKPNLKPDTEKKEAIAKAVLELVAKETLREQAKWDALDVNGKLENLRKAVLSLVDRDIENTEAIADLEAVIGKEGNNAVLKRTLVVKPGTDILIS